MSDLHPNICEPINQRKEKSSFFSFWEVYKSLLTKHLNDLNGFAKNFTLSCKHFLNGRFFYSVMSLDLTWAVEKFLTLKPVQG